MKSTTLIMFLGSFGFLIIGLISLLSKRIKKYFKESGVYKDTDKFMYYNGVFNLFLGLVGIVLGILDMIFTEKSKYIIIIYIIFIFILSTIQNKLLKKYKNI
ncbi:MULTISPECIES: hypothetical protein [unclassified Clostridium]|uniref:hypothetical protein n=2 Tax=Clostridium TaxID=1485 RepID=UPI0025B7AB1D|nr:hypothetical protein [Clostridium sp.]MCI6693902.1 hypothetical protein [Clostridium sp.]MDY2631498.1 hypothetical protein [Clostridium sp.]MDY4253612.1 hypothetical protein [Clostridium sp.]MDY6228933.1 hypothetical protein [Clostridium sp.]